MRRLRESRPLAERRVGRQVGEGRLGGHPVNIGSADISRVVCARYSVKRRRSIAAK